jgi:hypothetical protein
MTNENFKMKPSKKSPNIFVSLQRSLSGHNVTKLFMNVIYKCLLAVEFVCGKPLQPSLMFVGKARSLP